MSAVDFAARALALRANLASPRMYSELCAIDAPGEFRRFSSIGHNEPGMGPGTYVADSNADPSLVTEHPAAAFLSGRQVFRLMPDNAGFVTPEQFGCPIQVQGANAQPYIQAAIRYAERFGYGVQFTQSHYEVWSPLRIPVADPGTSVFPVGEPANFTGIPFIITRNIELRAAPGGTTLARKTEDGGDPAIFSNWSVIDDAYGMGTFRGGLFFLKGASSAPARYSDRPGIVFRGKWVLSGGIPQSDNPGLHVSGGKYALKPGGKGWDLYDKPIWHHNNRFTGDVVFDDLTIDGFRGELYYNGGQGQGSCLGDKLTLGNTDGDGFNATPSVCGDGQLGRCEINQITIHHAYQAFEAAAGPGKSRFGTVHIYDCTDGGAYSAGWYLQAPTYLSPIPSLTIDYLLIERTSRFGVCFYTTIKKLRLVDSIVHLGHAQGNFWNSRIDTIECVTDKVSQTMVVFQSIGTGPGAAYPPKDSSVGEIIHMRTDHARTNNIISTAPFTWGGGVWGDNVRVGRVTGECYYSPMRSSTDPTAFRPGLRDNFCKFTGPYSGSLNVETTPVPTVIDSYVINLTATNAGHFTLTLPSMAGKLPYGSRIQLLAENSATRRFSVATANTQLQKRAILQQNQLSEWEWQSGGWRLVSTLPPLLGTSGSVSLQKGGAPIPAGDVSDESTITVAGARPGMSVRVTPTSVVSGDAQCVGRITANDTVAIRARNMNLGAALSLGAATYRVELEWPN